VAKDKSFLLRGFSPTFSKFIRTFSLFERGYIWLKPGKIRYFIPLILHINVEVIQIPYH